MPLKMDHWTFGTLKSYQAATGRTKQCKHFDAKVNSGDALISHTTKHTGAIKTLQFNAFRHELLATAGAKGEVIIPSVEKRDY